MKLVIANDRDDLGRLAANEVIRIADEKNADGISCTVALSGGSTPVAMYKHLVENGAARRDIKYFFSDERNVSADDPQSNFKTANDHLFRPAGVADDQIFRWRTELGDAKLAADDYERILRKEFAANDAAWPPRFSLILLGIGSDGHAASLFPETDALNETLRMAVANRVEKLGADRLTFTFPIINNAENVIFLAAGNDKAEILRSVIDDRGDEFPAGRVNPASGTLQWFVDRDAATLVDGGYLV